MDSPVVVYCPYLFLNRPYQIGPWTLVPVGEFDGPWSDERFEAEARWIFGRYHDSDKEAPERLTLILNTARGADGAFPGNTELERLQAALDVGLLNTNPKWEVDRANRRPLMITSDNSLIEYWICDGFDGYVVLRSGGLIPVTSGGWNITDPRWRVDRPIEVPHEFNAHIDQDLANAVYRCASSNYEASHRIQTAIHWWSKSWRNSHSISSHDRLIYMKIAFEALTGKSGSWDGAKSLSGIFEPLSFSRTVAVLGSSELLWSPSDSPHRVRRWMEKGKEQTDLITDLQHWYCSFSEARNAIIHEGRIDQAVTYAVDDSPYRGPYIRVADRVFREALSVIVSTDDSPDLWREPIGRASARLTAGTNEK